ncbi:MAG: hypothetical protein WDO12_08385 [Pseudomonadota bacterium]
MQNTSGESNPRLKIRIAIFVALALATASTWSLSQDKKPAPVGTAPAAASAATPLSQDEQVEKLMRGKPYTGPVLPTPHGLDGKPDFSGFWRPVREQGKPGGNFGKDYPNFQLPFTAEGRRALLYAQNHTPDPEALCVLGGIPRHNASGLPFEVLHTPGRIAFTYLYNTSRRISIGNALRIDAQAPRRYFGTEVAHWDGETLVIETTGLFDSAHDRIWLDENGDPTSNATRVTERWVRPDFHHFHVDIIIDDPKYYSEPLHYSRTWEAAPAGVGQQEYACNESNLEMSNIGPGAGVIGPDGNRGYGKPAPLPEKPPGPEAYGL